MSETNEMTLLVVEDEPLLKDVITIEFEMLGFKVVSADNYRDAIELLNKHTVHVVISDIVMPGGGGTGLELLEYVNERNPKVKPLFFLMTGFTDMLDEDAMKQGIQAIFQKPFQRSQLINTVLSKLAPQLRSKPLKRKAA